MSGIFLGVDPGLSNLGVGVYDQNRNEFILCQVALNIKDGQLYEIEQNQYNQLFREKCETVLKPILSLDIQDVGIEHIFNNGNPKVKFVADVIFSVLSEYFERVHWICPKKWHKYTNTAHVEYADRKKSSWNSGIFDNLAAVQRHFTISGEKYEDALEAGLIAYCTGKYLKETKIVPSTPATLKARTKPKLVKNKLPTRPEFISYRTKCTGNLSVMPFTTRKRKAPVKKESNPKRAKKQKS